MPTPARTFAVGIRIPITQAKVGQVIVDIDGHRHLITNAVPLGPYPVALWTLCIGCGQSVTWSTSHVTVEQA